MPIVVSLGKCEDMPATSGEKLSRVKTEMETLGFSNVSYVGEYSADVAKDVVISQSISTGERINVETAIVIKYSLGKQPWPKTVVYQKGADGMSREDLVVHDFTCDLNVDGSYHFELMITAPAGMRTCLFDPPNGGVFKRVLSSTTGDKQTYVFDISSADLAQVDEIVFNVFNSDTERCLIFIYTNQLLT